MPPLSRTTFGGIPKGSGTWFKSEWVLCGLAVHLQSGWALTHPGFSWLGNAPEMTEALSSAN